MIPLMGITWLFGLLSPWHKAFAYIFTIFNSTQVSIRALVVITKSFRLHNHHRQFYSGEILMKMSEIWSSVWKLECPNYILTLVWWYFPFKGNLVDKRGFISWFLRSATFLNLPFYPFFTTISRYRLHDVCTTSNFLNDALPSLKKADLKIIFCTRDSWFFSSIVCETAR